MFLGSRLNEDLKSHKTDCKISADVKDSERSFG